MMKRIAFIVLVFTLMAGAAYGGTFHAIIFANTQDANIGESVAVDYGRMSIEMTTIAKSIGYPIKKYFYYGSKDKFSRGNLSAVISSLNCSQDDIIFFYYSGHGGRAANGNNKFPEMCLNVNEPLTVSHLYPLMDVYQKLKDKNARFTIVMGDLCNSVINGYFRDTNTSKGATVLSKETCDVYKNLFLNVRGGLIAASSEPGYTSGCCMYYQDGKLKDMGGYMTHSFLSMLQYCVNNNRGVSWEDLMDATIACTRRLTQENTRPQTPIYTSEVSAATPPVSSSPVNTPPQPPVSGNETSQADKVAYSLSMVCNQSVPKLERIHNIAGAKKHFAAGRAMVQVIGADNKTIVNTCGIDSYLNYLSMATNMDQVLVLEARKDSAGNISYVKVHEIHYQ